MANFLANLGFLACLFIAAWIMVKLIQNDYPEGPDDMLGETE